MSYHSANMLRTLQGDTIRQILIPESLMREVDLRRSREVEPKAILAS